MVTSHVDKVDQLKVLYWTSTTRTEEIQIGSPFNPAHVSVSLFIIDLTFVFYETVENSKHVDFAYCNDTSSSDKGREVCSSHYGETCCAIDGSAAPN